MVSLRLGNDRQGRRLQRPGYRGEHSPLLGIDEAPGGASARVFSAFRHAKLAVLACPTKPWRSREGRLDNRPALQRRSGVWPFIVLRDSAPKARYQNSLGQAKAGFGP